MGGRFRSFSLCTMIKVLHRGPMVRTRCHLRARLIVRLINLIGGSYKELMWEVLGVWRWSALNKAHEEYVLDLEVAVVRNDGSHAVTFVGYPNMSMA